MKKIIILNIVILFAFVFSLPAKNIKKENPDDRFYPDFQSDADMRISGTERKPFSISYGGWLNPMIIDLKSDDGSTDLMSSVSIAKLWFKSWLWKNSYIYIRGKYVYMAIMREKGTDRENSDHLMDLDTGFFSISNNTNTLNLFIGRKFFTIGTGLVFNGRGDGCEFDFYSKYADLKVFGAYTGLLLKDNNPYNLSDKDISDGAKRIFVGGVISKDIYNQTIYLLGLVQNDKGKNNISNNILQKTKYNSEYYGVGIKGIFKDAFYFGEFIHERGKSYLTVSSENEKKNIKANAALIGIDYYIPPSLFSASYNPKPVLLFRYAYGSSDINRDNYKSPNGNASGLDTGFLYFGTFTGGFALRPLLANLHVFRGGFIISPLSNVKARYLKRMNFSAKYSYYLKNISTAGINNGEAAVKNNRDIGHGVDVGLKWKIFYDLSMFVNYAIFIPGNAYTSSNDDNINFCMGGAVISF